MKYHHTRVASSNKLVLYLVNYKLTYINLVTSLAQIRIIDWFKCQRSYGPRQIVINQSNK